MVTLKDVARLAGVSQSTVSRTFTEGASVSDKTRRKVKKIAKKLGYSPSLIARSLATKRTELIGLIADNFQNIVFLEVFDLYTRALQDKYLRPLIVNLTDETDPQHSVRMLKQYNVDGVIIATSTLSPQFARAFKQANVPVVHTFGRFDINSDIHVVGIDNYNCGIMAAETLLDHGYRNISILAGPASATSTEDRVAGFKHKMNEANIKINSIHYARNYSYNAGEDEMNKMMSEDIPEVVFCGDDLICMGAMDAVKIKGMRVPEDIGFLGFNDMVTGRWDAYNLSTIRQPIKEIILSSVELVVSLIENPDRIPESRVFQCKVIERGTLLKKLKT